MQFRRVDDIVLYARQDGDLNATPIVFVNALGTDMRLWSRLCRYLSERLRLVRYDQRGHGLSGLGTPPYDVTLFGHDLAGLLDQLDTGPAIICGVSLGGMVAISLAERRPDLVRGLVLMDTAAKIGTAEIWQARRDAVLQGGIEAIADAVMERWFPAAFRTREADEIEGWRTMLTRTPKLGYLGAMTAVADADLTAAAARLHVPSLCLAGEHDGSTPPAEVAALAATIPNADFSLIHDAGHLPCIDQPAAVAAAILAFAEANGWA
ncbi:MAG: 3-oxoadipate enol-lactonase [Geminicoccaceae bacterium]|nr:MAG: 3-oxoadipate enol-lactonase [Geminicoccaceae bacterium]